MQADNRCSSSSFDASADGSDDDGKEKPETVKWTEEEEVKLLRAALEIAREPVESFDASLSPVERIRRAVGGEFTAMEIVRKTKQLRKRYDEMCRRRRQANADVFGVAFQISDEIWGRHGGEAEKGREKGKKRGRNAV